MPAQSKTIQLLILSIIMSVEVLAQNSHWVFFKDKCSVDFDPYEYFDAKAIERRIKHHLPLYDDRDLPVCGDYLSQIELMADSVGYSTRWLNGVAVYCNDEGLSSIQELTFVQSVQPMLYYSNTLAEIDPEVEKSLAEELAVKQLERMGIDVFDENGLTGKGVRIAIFDAGFPGVNTMDEFEHIRNRNGIISTYDFVKKTENVFAFNQHGTNVLSCAGGRKDGKRIGFATGAEYLLARTENAHREPFSEEQNWLKAVEWADKHGVDIINSSLAYTQTRYFRWEMDGKHSLVSKAANIAASKGILVVSAAGNDGDTQWKYIGTPGDADSALTVGGIDPNTDYHIDFSSYGPTQDKRLKPNVTAFGEAAVAGRNGLTIAQGTSFASPLVAGYAACLLENNSQLTAMQLYHEIERSSDLYPYFDYAHGYGVPQASTAIYPKEEQVNPTFEFEKGQIALSVKVQGELNVSEQNLIYYHVENLKGYLDRYYVVSVDEEYPLRLYLDEFKKGQVLRVHYKGYTEEYRFDE